MFSRASKRTSEEAKREILDLLVNLAKVLAIILLLLLAVVQALRLAKAQTRTMVKDAMLVADIHP